MSTSKECPKCNGLGYRGAPLREDCIKCFGTGQLKELNPTPVFIRCMWPFDDRPSLLRFALITTHLRLNIGFTYNDIHKYCERALKRPLTVPEFDLVMRRIDEEAPCL